MPQNKVQPILELLLIFGLFFLSNSSAFLHVVWVVPEIVFMETVIWLVLTALTLWILSRQHLFPILFDGLKMNWIIFPFLIFSGLSIIWSVYWQISLLRWLILLCTIITGAYIGLRYDIKGIIKLLSVFGIYILFLSSILVFFVPRLGVMNYYIIHGAWKGVYWHKNHMGLISSFINILFLINVVYSLWHREKNILFWGMLYLFSLFFIYQSDSVGAYFTTIFLHGLILLALLFLKFGKNIHRSHYFMFFIALIFISLLLFINLDHIFSMFGRNTSMTGRVPMWAHLFDMYFSKHPYFGYGFNAFWYIDAYRVEMGQAAGYPDQIVIADNGFIDMLVNTGFIGLIIFSIFYLGLWWRSVQHAGKAGDINGFFPVILMAFTLLANISWSLIFENEGFFMLIMISVLFSISAGSAAKNGSNDLNLISS